jgi:serum/glucocorticoid-regulated kinase 3
MYDNILHKPVRLSTNISLAARSILELYLIVNQFFKNFHELIIFISSIVSKRQEKTGSMDDTEELKRNQFFKPINWTDLESKNILKNSFVFNNS